MCSPDCIPVEWRWSTQQGWHGIDTQIWGRGVVRPSKWGEAQHSLIYIIHIVFPAVFCQVFVNPFLTISLMYG